MQEHIGRQHTPDNNHIKHLIIISLYYNTIQYTILYNITSLTYNRAPLSAVPM